MSKKSKSIRLKLISLLITVIIIFNMASIPLSAIGSEDMGSSGSYDDAQATKSPVAHESSSLDEIQIPHYGSNPNSLSNNNQVLPIYTTGIYNYLRDYSSEFTSYGKYYSRNETRSQYYTGSVLIHGNVSEHSKNASTSALPYTEERSLMFHPELTASGDGYLSGTLYAEDYEYSTPNGDSIWNYLDPEQVKLKFSGTVVSGNGELRVSYDRENSSAYDYQIFKDEFTYNINSQGYKTTLKQLEDGETYNLSVTIPISTNSYSFDVGYYPWGGNSVITDAHAALIDDSAPYVKDVHFEMIKGLRDNEADLVMKVTFNEGIRYLSDYNLEEDYAKTYVIVSAWNATKGKHENIKLYLDKVDGGKTITFRANIGKLHYHDLQLTEIESFSLPKTTHRPIDSGFMDLVDGMVVGVGRVKNYDNAVGTPERTILTNGVTRVSFLSDHAGNPVDFTSLSSWNVRSYEFLSDTFAAERIEIYNDKTLGIISGASTDEQARSHDFYVGPQRDMTIYVRINKALADEIWPQVYITLNIIDKEGNELKIYPTSASQYTDDEVYTDGVKKGMLIKFENVPLSSDMTIDVEDGADPQIIVTGMGTDYTREETGYPTAYPYVQAPNNVMYADFNAPTVEVRKTVERTDEADGKYYKVSAEITASDGDENQKVSGLEGSVMLISLMGGVEKETPIRYLLSTDPIPPESNEGYTKSAVISPNGKLSLGQITLISSSERFYLHILTESGGIYVNDLEVIASLCDAVGNGIEAEIPNTVEYIIDEIAPTVSIDSKRATAAQSNSTINLTVDLSASDHTRVDRLLYCFGNDTLDGDEEWQVAEITEFGSFVTATVSREYGDPNSQNPDVNRIYFDTLWVKAYDMYGNESQPTSVEINLSLQKPSTSVKYLADPNKINRGGELLVSGPAASSFDGSDAYTRVTVTSIEDSEYSYVTLVKTGDSDVDILALDGLVWYRVKIDNGIYKEVSAPVELNENYSGELLDGLLNCYGEIRISFENGYGNMVPTVGPVSAMANAGSYISDPYYYTVRYSSPFNSNSDIHYVDFGSIVEFAAQTVNGSSVIQTNGNVVVENADKGAAPYVFNQTHKGVNPMRNTQIHYSIANIANDSYGLLDFDYKASYAELIKVGEDGEDTVVAVQNGLWATDNQYFAIKPLMDNGEYFTTGAYYLRVTVVSGDGRKNGYESSRVVLDAQTADNAGLWEYSYGSVENITAIDDTRYAQVTKTADSSAFDSIGIAVISGGGETSRDRLFATYSYGIQGLEVVLGAGDTKRTVEGVEVGKVAGFKVWNLLSAPTEGEIAARGFELTNGGDTLIREAVTSTIYTSETIPTGILGMNKLFLTKGTNTICYQVKMANGYVSPIRQFTITVTDEVPQLSVAIGGYQPSITASQADGVINADHIRYYVDTAYSVNGTGNVKVNLWSSYDMNLGLLDENGNINDTFTDSSHGTLKLLYEGMRIEEYADLTENSYTANFPQVSIARCTAVFVAIDEYGGVSIVAPQIGDIERINVDAGIVENAHEIDIEYYGGYFDDPYDAVYSPYGWRILYNQPKYFGAQILGFETYLVENTSEGEVRVKDIQEAEDSLRYNLFNISTNDISMSNGNASYTSEKYVSVEFDEYENGNKEYILLSDATVTLYGGYIGNEPITLTFLDGDVTGADENGEGAAASRLGNTVGYMHGYLSSDGLRFYVANPRADESNPVGTTVDISYILRYSNQYGDKYEHSGVITLTYIEYRISGTEMTESGARLNFSFEPKDLYNSGIERTGIFSSGTYKATVPDYFGNSIEYSYTVQAQADLNTYVKYENHKNTANPVTVTLMGLYDIYVDVTDYAVMSVENNGTGTVTVKIYENTRFSYRYYDLTGHILTYYINVDNIYKPSPEIRWDYNKESYNVSEDGVKYRYGSVTVYLTDKSFTLVDRYTGQIPTFTFLPGGDSTYTFSKEDVVARLGNEEIELANDITVVLDVVLYEVPSIEFSDEDDDETPNVQVKAYSKLNEAYFDTKMLMQLTGIRNSTVFSRLYGYESYEYVGNRANMSEILNRMGWSTSYRFTVETVDSNKVRLFIKEGLYAEAPDYNTGKSDIIEGVDLNSKLLTVIKNAKFTLFVVDSANNYSSVAFNITNISDAPVPTVMKIPVSHDLVRLYVIAPDGVAEEDLKIFSPECKFDTDTESPYYLKKYIEISANDDYDIIYEMTYNDTTVTDTLTAVSVTEISLDEIVMQELSWSANKASEATPNEITVDIRFSHNVTEISALQSYDPDKVRFEIAGNNVRVIYNDNHRAISFAVIADNSTYVYVELDEVTNIDKTAPNISLIREELAPNGKSLTLTLSSNERAGFKENNGAIGEAVTDDLGNTLYYYTVRITENGEYTFTFVDMSGIMTTYIYKTSALVLDELTVWYNTSPVFDGAVDDPYQLSLKSGDKIYINPERNATARFTGLDILVEMTGGEWLEFTVPEASGGIAPYAVYTDEFVNTLTHQFSRIEIPDNTPPEIVISKKTYAVRVGVSAAEIEEALLANFVAFDDTDDTVQLAVDFTSNIEAIGLTDVKYMATDTAGNTSAVYGKLRITSIYEPEVYVAGIQVLRDEGVHLEENEEIKLNIDTKGVAYKVILANGVLTSAQMKNIESIDGYSTTSVIDLGALQKGIYTVLIVTEQREYFRILIAVEDF